MFNFHRRASFNSMTSLNGDVGANSAQFTKGDALTYDTDGFLIPATAGTRIVGFANVNLTMAADNETVGLVKVQFETFDTRDLFECDASAAITRTNISQYADLTGGTGAQLIDQGTVSDNTGQFRIAMLDPRQESSTVRLLVNVAESEHLAYTQD